MPLLRKSLVVAIVMLVVAGRCQGQTCPSPIPTSDQLEHPSHSIVRFCLPEGPIDIELFSTTAPNTVANFLNYVANGSYNGSIFHRLDNNFVLQGGGFTYSDSSGFVPIPTNPPIANEFNRSNLARTVAMARVGGNPHSATSQFFINLQHNTFLDSVDGGMTVFGRVIGDESWSTVLLLNEYPIINQGSPFNELPVRPAYMPPLESSELLIIQTTCFAPACCPVPEIVQEPSNMQATNGGIATLTVIANPQIATTYQWRRSGEVFGDGLTRHGSLVSGTSTDTLVITNVRTGDEALYDCLLSNSCGTTVSAGAQLSINCAADFDQDGSLTVADIFAFLIVWFTGAYPASDFNNDQAVNVQDIFAFLGAWFAGCP